MEPREKSEGLKARLAKSEPFEKEVAEYLARRAAVIQVVRNGSELTHRAFVDSLRDRTDPGSLLLRFTPDGLYLTANGTHSWEAKASLLIERQAYRSYMIRHQNGERVVIFVRPAKKHNPGPKQRGVKRWYIDEDEWMCPRRKMSNTGGGSGTDCKAIALASMHAVTDFYNAIEATRDPVLNRQQLDLF